MEINTYKQEKNEYGLREFILPEGERKPFALILPGGGYGLVSFHNEGVPYAQRLNENGYAAFLLRYRVKRKAKYPAPLEDVARALRYITDNAERLNVAADDYSVWGSSAGGHLAGLFSSGQTGYIKYNLPKPKATVLCYPVITMGEDTHIGSKRCLLGPRPSAELINLTSIEKLVDKDFPPTFVWYSLADETVKPVNSKMLIDALKLNNIPYKAIEYKNVPHGIGLGEGTECEGWFEEAMKFLKSEK